MGKIHCNTLWSALQFAFVCFLIRSHTPSPGQVGGSEAQKSLET